MLYLVLVTLVLWAAVFGREWIALIKALGREFLAAPVRNTEVLETFPLNISLGAFLVLLNLLRLAGLLAAALVTAWFSGQASTWEKAALPAAGCSAA